MTQVHEKICWNSYVLRCYFCSSPSSKVKAARRKRCISHTERTTEIKSCRPGAGKGHTRRYENCEY